MRLKRLYDAVTGKVRGINVLEASAAQNFSPRLIDKGTAEGWLRMEKGRIVVAGHNVDLRYTIVLPPGYYCCHCNRALDDGPAGREHVDEAHGDAPSPDPNNPAGYRRDNFFACRQEN